MDYHATSAQVTVPLVDRSHFLDHPEGAYLATAGEGLMPRGALTAVERYLRTKADPTIARREQAEIDQRVRERLGRLCGSPAEQIALLANASQALTMIYGQQQWEAGDNVVLMSSDLEFPSLVLPAVKLVRDQNIELRVVDHSSWIVEPNDIARAVDSRTKMIVVSHVSYRTGFRLDLNRLREAISGSDAWLLVDASQSLGAVPVDMAAADFLVATSCKWMLAPHGVGVLSWNPARTGQLIPRDIGWYSVVDDLEIPYELKEGAARFELGGPAWPTIYALDAGLELIEEVGIDRIAQHNEQLTDKILEAVRPRDLEVLTPEDPSLRAGIVSWTDGNPTETALRLQRESVFVTGSSGRIRTSVHLYNDESDVERLSGAL